MRWQSILTTTAIASALAGYILLMRNSDDELRNLPAPAQPGYYLQQATITETGPDGQPRMKLQADRINQNPVDESISLERVSVTYRSNDRRTWLLTAERGYLTNSHRIDFNGNVHIRPQDASPSSVAAPQIRTDALSIDTDQNIAQAPGTVRLEFGTQQLTAVGMKFDIARQALRLESNVNGQFR